MNFIEQIEQGQNVRVIDLLAHPEDTPYMLSAPLDTK